MHAGEAVAAMSALSHAPAAFAIHRVPDSDRTVPASATPTLRLMPSGDGWSLVGPGGELVFSALGAQGRRRCLQYARAHGVLAVLS
jgi:hypothetical protein